MVRGRPVKSQIRRKFRATIDSRMEFFKIGPMNNTFLHKIPDHNNYILELK